MSCCSSECADFPFNLEQGEGWYPWGGGLEGGEEEMAQLVKSSV